jgi:hypothetical protein
LSIDRGFSLGEGCGSGNGRWAIAGHCRARGCNFDLIFDVLFLFGHGCGDSLLMWTVGRDLARFSLIPAMSVRQELLPRTLLLGRCLGLLLFLLLQRGTLFDGIPLQDCRLLVSPVLLLDSLLLPLTLFLLGRLLVLSRDFLVTFLRALVVLVVRCRIR